MTIPCPIGCSRKESPCSLSPVGPSDLDQVGGSLAATRYFREDCQILVTVTLRDPGSEWVPRYPVERR